MKNLIDMNPRVVYGLGGVALLVALILAVWFGYRSGHGQAQNVASIIPVADAEGEDDPSCVLRRYLDGVCVDTPEEQTPPVVGVMIENHFEARPLAGVASAAVVYEAPVEGHIPRFLALYPRDSEVKKVGPVRSARPYYVDWIGEYGTAMYVHVGGSPDALEKIAADGVFDMNEFSRGWYFWRSDDRGAPHNVYTSSDLWQKAWERYAPIEATSTFSGWRFDTREMCDVSSEEECVSEIRIQFLRGTYEPVWRLNTTTEQYERYEFGQRYADEDGTLIAADTIVVQWVEASVLDSIGRLGITTVGSGKATIFRDGMVTEGEWRKEVGTDRTRWIGADGRDIPLKSGKIWVEVLPIGAKVTQSSF